MMITILVISDFALYTLQESILIRELGFCKRHSQELQYYITAKCKIIFFSVLFHFTSFNWFLWIDKKKLSNQSSSKRVKLHFEHRWDVTEKLKSSYILMPPRCNWFWAFQLHPLMIWSNHWSFNSQWFNTENAFIQEQVAHDKRPATSIPTKVITISITNESFHLRYLLDALVLRLLISSSIDDRAVLTEPTEDWDIRLTVESRIRWLWNGQK